MKCQQASKQDIPIHESVYIGQVLIRFLLFTLYPIALFSKIVEDHDQKPINTVIYLITRGSCFFVEIDALLYQLLSLHD